MVNSQRMKGTPAVFLLSLYPKGSTFPHHRDICMPAFTSALFRRAKLLNPPKYHIQQGQNAKSKCCIHAKWRMKSGMYMEWTHYGDNCVKCNTPVSGRQICVFSLFWLLDFA